MRTAVLTVSDRVSRGTVPDTSGDALAELLAGDGYDVERRVVPDEPDQITGALRELTATAALVLTTGGTGVAPRDVTPEATLAVIEREVPGIAEAMRAASRPHTKHWMLSRAVAGIRGSTLIVNFPGSPRSIEQTAAAIGAALPHALALIAGRPSEH